MNDAIQYFTDKYHELESTKTHSALAPFREKGLNNFKKFGIPVRHEEWKYTRISNVLRKDFDYVLTGTNLTAADLKPLRLPTNAS